MPSRVGSNSSDPENVPHFLHPTVRNLGRDAFGPEQPQHWGNGRGGARSSGSIFHDEQFVTGPIRPGKSVRGIGEKGFYLPWRESGNLSCYLVNDAVSLLLVSQ